MAEKSNRRKLFNTSGGCKMIIKFAINSVFTEKEYKNFITECKNLKDNEPEKTDEPGEINNNGVFFSHKLLHKLSDHDLDTIVKRFLLK
mmetsp:Transcript_1897/g.2374  ORF Transcript_1897/g.2374 Transcript_1897/m.2374 type:complete len:89 (+) Transcript_1897:115-381(+)